MMLLRRKKFPFDWYHYHGFHNTITSTFTSSSSHNHHDNLIARIWFSTSTPTPQSSADYPFMVNYLRNSCGLSLDKALKASKQLAHMTSASRPDSVIHFFKHHGFNDNHIKDAISKRPKLLCAKVDQTLKPKLMALKELGFSEAELARLVAINPNVLTADPRPIIEYLLTFFKSKEDLLRAVKREPYLIFSSLEKRIVPSVTFLRNCGVSQEGIVKILIYNPGYLTRRNEYLKEIVERAQRFGVSCNSRMFWRALFSVGSISKTGFDAKVKLLKSFGWSDAEFLSAVRSFPFVVCNSVEKLRSNMEFLLNDVGCQPLYVAAHPVLLSLSLEKRLIPRHRLWKALKDRDLLGRAHSLASFMGYPEKKFVDKFVLLHEEKASELLQIYGVGVYCQSICAS